MDMAKPIIRFKGYQDDWEQRKSGEIAPLRGGFAFKSNEYSPDGVPIVRISNILSDGSVGSDFAYYGEQNSDDMYALYDGAVVLAMSGATTGKISVLHTKKGQKYYQNQRVGYFTPTDSCDYGFIKTIMRSQLFAEQLSSVLVAGAQPNVSSREIDGFEFMIPKSKDEQQKIGVYFSKLDHLITLHQRKCDETKRLKKYMLQKMFPQNGEKVPEIRFSGFTDDWEQRKLSEIALQTYGGGTPKTANEEFWKGNIPWIQSSDLIEERLFNVKPRKYISQEAISKSATKLVPQNSVAMVTRVGVGKLAFMPFSYATSQDFLSLSELKIEPEFVVYALYKMMRLVSNEVQGTSIKGITKDELLAKEILIPDCEEQKKIGAYLHNLDHLITLHQRELENLQNIKRFMLGKMFV